MSKRNGTRKVFFGTVIVAVLTFAPAMPASAQFMIDPPDNSGGGGGQFDCRVAGDGGLSCGIRL